MVADEDAGAFEGTEMLQPRGFDAAAHGFERGGGLLAAARPCLAVIDVLHGLDAGFDDNPDQGAVKAEARAGTAKP